MNAFTIVRLGVSPRHCRKLAGLMVVCVLTAGDPHVCAEGVLRLDIARTNSNVVLIWTNGGVALETSLVLTGAWNELTNAVSGLQLSPSNVASFFRLRGIAAPANFNFRYVAPTFTTSIGDPFGCGCTSPENPNGTSAGGSAQDNGMGSVFLHTGEVVQHAVDLEIPGRGFNWRFERFYRSGMNYDGPMGQGWDFNYNRRLSIQTNGDALRVDGIGRVDRYVLSSGVFQAPSGFYSRLATNTGNTFVEHDRHGTEFFYSATNELGVARLARIRDRNNNEMNFYYNASNQLARVVDTLDRTNLYAYDVNGRLTSVTDFSGRVLTHAYNATGDLISATSPIVTGTPNGNDFPSGKTTKYTYSSGFGDARFNHNLLTVTAPSEFASGPARLTAQFDTNPVSPNADRVLSLTLGGVNSNGVAAGGTIRYAYTNLGTAGPNDFATAIFQNTTTNRNGNVTEYRVNQLGNIVRRIQFTRGVRAGDPAGFTNTFAYNQDGEMLSRTNAEGDAVTYSYNTNSADRLQQGNLLQVRRLPGPRGGDQSQILTSMSYETNFNFVATNTDPRGGLMIYKYDARGNLTNTVHRISSIVEDSGYNQFGQRTNHVLPDNGSGHRRRDEMIYYSTGTSNGYLQSTVVDSGPTNLNLTTIYEYDAVGNVTRVIDPRTNDTLYAYNALNQLVRKSSPPASGGIRDTNFYWYDANNNRVRADMVNRNDSGALQANTALTTITEYDILDQITREVREKGSANLADSVVTYNGIPGGSQPQFLTAEYRYDANQNWSLTRFGQATSGADPFNTVSNLYDERDLVYRAIRASGSADQSTSQTDYDRNGNVQRMLQGIENAPRTNSYSYDGYDRLVRTLDPMGNTQTNRYDANGNVLTNRVDGQLVDVLGSSGNVRLSEVRYSYDAMDRLTNRADQFFDPQTQTAIGDGQATTKYTYSANSQVVIIIDDNTNGTIMTYDNINRLQTVTDARSNSVTYIYDPNNRLRQQTKLHIAEVLGLTNQSLVILYSYDRNDRRVAVTDNGSNTVEYGYDSRDNHTVSTNGRGNRTIHSYDGLKRRVSTTHLLTDTGAGGGTVIGGITNRQTWDDSSRLISQTDGNGNTTQYVYDSLDRLIRTQYTDVTGSTNSYDVHNNRIQTADANGTVVFTTYDPLNRVTANAVFPAPGVLGTTNESYSYDGLSRLVRAANDDSVVSNRFDSLSHLTRETQQVLPGGAVNTVTMTYDGVGNQTSITYPSGRIIVRTFDSLNRVKISRDDPPGPGATNAFFQYIGPGRVARVDYGNGAREDVTYDAVPRVRTIQHSALGSPFFDHLVAWDQSHNLLLNTNRLFVGTSKQYQYDSVNRLVRSDDPAQFGTTIYGLDAVGNRTNVAGVSGGDYIMDPTLPEPADRQMNQYTTTPTSINVFDPDGNLRQTGQNASIPLNYDFRNRLVQVYFPNLFAQATYKYDCFGRRIEKNYFGITRFVYAGFKEIEEQSSSGSPLATYVWFKSQLLQMNRNSQTFFYHADQLGSPVAITDGSGSVVENITYDDYGIPNPGISSVGNPFLLAGQRYDSENGWYLSGSRYLDPVAGRFVTRGDRTLGNPFTFAANNPVSLAAVSQDPDIPAHRPFDPDDPKWAPGPEGPKPGYAHRFPPPPQAAQAEPPVEYPWDFVGPLPEGGVRAPEPPPPTPPAFERRIGARLEGGWDKPPPIDWIKIAKILEDETDDKKPELKNWRLKIAKLLRDGKIQEARQEWRNGNRDMIMATLAAIGQAAGDALGH
jgi:RHS repeat-associated protein